MTEVLDLTYTKTMKIEDFFYSDNLHYLNVSEVANISAYIDQMDTLKFNKRVNNFTYYSFILIYLVIIILGFAENISIINTCFRNKMLKTTRNILIANLALSNIFLCLFTMPLTMLDLIHTYWPLGSGQEVLCQLNSASQSAFVFFSSFSVAVIAVDRLMFIAFPGATQISTHQAFLLSAVGVVCCGAFSAPLFIFTKMEVLFKDASYCYEAWPSQEFSLVYTFTSLTVQYIIPSITVACAYIKVYLIFQASTKKIIQSKSSSRTIRNARRRRKTNIILVLISAVFFLSWAPLNIFTILIKTANPFKSESALVTMFGLCHLVGMSFACTSPVLYGFLNKNFKHQRIRNS